MAVETHALLSAYFFLAKWLVDRKQYVCMDLKNEMWKQNW